jgi:Kef-type K+ transport system membrane component KefB
VNPQVVGSLAVIAVAAVAAPVLAQVLHRFRVPGVVLEILAGILVGPHLLNLVKPSDFVSGLSELGLAFLMFLAGFEIDLHAIRGRPLATAVASWGISLPIAGVAAVILHYTGLTVSHYFIALALTTTALGTLLPILRDAGVSETPFGCAVLAAGTVGEFAPIVAIALFLTSSEPAKTGVLLVVFVAVGLAAGLVALHPRRPALSAMLSHHLRTSAQLPVRIAFLAIAVLIWLASDLGLDALLGAFAAGMILRLASTGPDAELFSHKLEAVGYGFVVPVFFIVTGTTFQADALKQAGTLIRIPVFLALFLLVRGLPMYFALRGQLTKRERRAVAVLGSTGLPVIVVITTIGLGNGEMQPETAAGLIAAGMLSVLIFPLVGLALARRSDAIPAEPALEVEGVGADRFDGDEPAAAAGDGAVALP